MNPDRKPASTDQSDALATFDDVRRKLFGIAYRITGTVADAEDVVQETWIRWQLSDRSLVRDATAFLATIATRLAINVLTSAHTTRETYIGPWLPAPVDTADDPALGAERDEALHFATLILMERLRPSERAAYVLREAFDYPYSRIAAILESTEAAARQLVSRARRRLSGEPARVEGRNTHRAFLEAFLRAARAGDTARLEMLLTADAISYTDGGGVVRHTARRPIYGRDKVVRFFAGLARWFWADIETVAMEVNGRAGAYLVHGSELVAVFTVTVQRDAISQILWMMNPAKLGAVANAGQWHPARADWVVASERSSGAELSSRTITSSTSDSEYSRVHGSRRFEPA